MYRMMNLYFSINHSPPSPPASTRVLGAVELVMEEHGLHMSHSVEEAVIFYVSLMDALEDV